MAPSETVHLVINPAAGEHIAGEFVSKHVEPLIRSAGYLVRSYGTQSAGDAARIAREIGTVASSGAGGISAHTVVLAGGDGTAHEFIEGVCELQRSKSIARRWNLVIVPLGTANALYASTYPPGTALPTFSSYPQSLCGHLTTDERSRLNSLAAFLDSKKRAPSRLHISLLSLHNPNLPSASPPIPIPSHVVISTCLHANLLATAESLRSQYPGVERFKVAAQQNAGRFYPAQVTLYPSDRVAVEVYNPATASFIPLTGSASSGTEGVVVIEDEFAYFLTSATCPRLEPTFVISPLISRFPQEGSVCVTILRPMRDPSIRTVLSTKGYSSIREAREAGDQETLTAVSEAWVPRAWEVLTKAYDDGAHVELTYTSEGGTESRGVGEVVVEVFRCAGFKWNPLDPSDDKSHLVCADGSLIHTPAGGSASVRFDDHGPPDAGVFLYL